MKQFLGRRYCEKTHTWIFADGSGRIPDEMRQDVIDATYERGPIGCNGPAVLSTLFSWKDRLSEIKEGDSHE